MALTNSDRSHGEDVQRSLGFRLSHWLSAEEAGVYKPDEAFWRRASEIVGIPFGPDWWHVSAYGDYDLTAARRLGLTCVLIPRAHHRVGPFDVTAPDLVALAEIAARA
jgi:FMN phosphatase YigB (HAD superfamily)